MAGTEGDVPEAGAPDGDELHAIAAVLAGSDAMPGASGGEELSAASTMTPAESEPAAGDPELAVEAPDFWAAEDKALWSQVPAPVRAILRKYEQRRVAHGERKSQEAASAREEAARATQAADKLVKQAAAWWQTNGPALRDAFATKWANVDWKGLAEKDPQEVARLIDQRQKEELLLTQARERGEADAAAARAQGERALLAARQAEHAKLAERLPEYFGPERARATYDELGRFLAAKGIAPDRIAAIYEAPIIELALAAMRFDQAQQTLRQRARRAPDGETNPAKTTPLRIAPGPGSTPGNRAGDALRQAGERFRQGGGTSIADAAELIRLSGL